MQLVIGFGHPETEAKFLKWKSVTRMAELMNTQIIIIINLNLNCLQLYHSIGTYGIKPIQQVMKTVIISTIWMEIHCINELDGQTQHFIEILLTWHLAA